MIHHRFSHSGGCCYISVNLPHVWVWIWKIVCMNLLQKINLVFQYSMIFFIHWRSGLNKTCNNVSFKHDENWYNLTSKLTHTSLPTWQNIAVPTWTLSTTNSYLSYQIYLLWFILCILFFLRRKPELTFHNKA